ncbi:MAG: S8 family serine peptidase [Cyanobacteria bacterium P01_F01_bin.143]
MSTRVIIQMRYSQPVARAAFEAAPIAPAFPLTGISGLQLDEAYQPVPVPAKSRRSDIPRTFSSMFSFDTTPEASSYLMRAEVEDNALDNMMENARQNDNVVGVFADVKMQAIATCPAGPLGTDRDVERLLEIDELQNRGLDGTGVNVVIVDSGVNIPYLNQRGKNPDFNEQLSWGPSGNEPVGQMPVGHGTMCAYDVCIAAPNCVLIDHALLRPTPLDALLSDAVRSYDVLLRWLNGEKDSIFAGDDIPASLVVNNSWGMFHPSWDFPIGSPSNYSDNPDHPFNIIVESLEDAGADILFAAGNCGRECADPRCDGATSEGIYGANSSDAVLSVAGVVTTNKDRIGYSTQGPGRLVWMKPDIACYTHFAGSGVYPADGGTSAATPVAAGVIAAIRRAYPSNILPPAVLRNLIRRTAEDRGRQGFDFDYGFGILDVKNLLTAIDNYLSER